MRSGKTKKDGVVESLRKDRRAYIVPAVDKAIRILSLLRSEGREMTIAEISHATGWHKSSIFRLLLTLIHHGLLSRDSVTKRYSLGFALVDYGRAVLNGFDIRHAAKPFLKNLARHSGETAALFVLQGTRLTLVELEESKAEVRVSLAVGLTTPATATSNGKAILAHLPESQAREIMQIEGLPRNTRKSITQTSLFRTDLETTRERGYATDYEEFQEGIVGISAPVFSSKGVVGAISIVMPAFRISKERTRNYGRKCAEEAARLSALLK